MQHWVSRDAGMTKPYRLYAISNAGSLLALLSYPFIWEPRLAMNAQTAVWSWSYGVFIVLAAALALTQLRRGDVSSEAADLGLADAAPRVAARDRLSWFL